MKSHWPRACRWRRGLYWPGAGLTRTGELVQGVVPAGLAQAVGLVWAVDLVQGVVAVGLGWALLLSLLQLAHLLDREHG